MNRARVLRFVAILTVTSLAPALSPAQAQPADSVLTNGVEISRFTRGADLAVDPDGVIYVADAGRGEIVRLNRDGRVLGRLGRRGSGEAQFDSPASVDPTNGFVLLVADAGNARVQRWSRDGQYLESIPVPIGDRTDRRPSTSYLPRIAAVDARASGRPMAVISTPDDRMVVIEAESARLLAWDRDRRTMTVGGDLVMQRPVALASDGRTIYVADPGAGRIHVLDSFGTPIRSIGAGVAAEIRNVFLEEGQIMAVLPREIVVFEESGRMIRRLYSRLSEELVDAAVFEGEWFLLTAEALYRFD